ncbi:MAG: hypothetical protein AAB316_18540 [Bacteroidota bacterium]
MEITDIRTIEIFHTLEKIQRMNRAIAFHRAIANPDRLAIEQYQRLKNDFTQQLLELLGEMDLRLKMAA